MSSIIFDFLISLIDLLKISLFFSVILFVPYLFSLKVRSFIQSKRKDLNWIKSTYLTSFVISFAVIFFIYVYFPLSAMLGESYEVPVAPLLLDVVLFIIFAFLRIIAKSIVLSLLLMPICFIGAFAHALLLKDRDEKEFSLLKKLLFRFIGLWFVLIVLTFSVLTFLSEAFVAIIYFIFFGLG